MSVAAYMLNDFRCLFEQEGTRFDADEFVEYAREHYSREYDHIRTCFIGEKLAEGRAAYQEEHQMEAEEAAIRRFLCKEWRMSWVLYIRNG